MDNAPKNAAAVLRDGGASAPAEAVSAAAALLGSRRTERKAEVARANGRRGGGRLKPLASIPCNCGRGAELDGHPTTCPRGHRIWWRRRHNKPLD